MLFFLDKGRYYRLAIPPLNLWQEEPGDNTEQSNATLY